MEANTTVRMFGALHTARKERGEPSMVGVTIPAEGCSAYDLAHDLDLPMEKVVGVFINHKAYGLDHLIQPGDRVAFIPKGVPVHFPLRGILGLEIQHGS